MNKMVLSLAGFVLLAAGAYALNQTSKNPEAPKEPIVAANASTASTDTTEQTATITSVAPANAADTAPVQADPIKNTKAFGEPLVLLMGKADAPVVIEEFASLSCSHCAHFEKDILPEVKKKLIDSGKARLEMYSYLRNAPDLRGSMLLSCLKDNEKRWRFVKALFSMQEQWAFDENFENSLSKIAQAGGMNKTDFAACMSDKKLEEALIKQRETIDKERKIEGTPTFYINGKKLDGAPTVEAFSKAIP